MDFVWFILIGLCAGWLAGMIMKGSDFGLLGNLIVGVIGAILGGAIFRALQIGTTGLIGSLICATVGAIVLLFLISFISKKRRR